MRQAGIQKVGQMTITRGASGVLPQHPQVRPESSAFLVPCRGFLKGVISVQSGRPWSSSDSDLAEHVEATRCEVGREIAGSLNCLRPLWIATSLSSSPSESHSDSSAALRWRLPIWCWRLPGMLLPPSRAMTRAYGRSAARDMVCGFARHQSLALFGQTLSSHQHL